MRAIIAACTKWRVRACRDGNPAACDYDEPQKQKVRFDGADSATRTIQVNTASA
jgi:hypothetical protein